MNQSKIKKLFLFSSWLTTLAVVMVSLGGVSAHDGFRWLAMDIDDPDQVHYRGWHEMVQRSADRVRGVRAGALPDRYPEGHYFPDVLSTGAGLELVVPRGFARPGDRYVEVYIEISPELGGQIEELSLVAGLIPAGNTAPVAEWEWKPEQRFGLLEVDMRDHHLRQARLVLSLQTDSEVLATAETVLMARDVEEPMEAGLRIPVIVDAPSGFPEEARAGVTFGVPFPAGALWEASQLRLIDEDGVEVPSQTEVMGRWADQGSIKWVRFDSVVTPSAGLFVEVASPSGALAQPLSVEERDGEVVIDTGRSRFHLAKGASPVVAAYRGDAEVARLGEARGLYVIDQNGRLAVASAEDETMEIESDGPLQASVRFEGAYRTEEGEELIRHITRVEAFAGEDHVDVTHTLVFSRESHEIWFQEIGWELEVTPGENPQAWFGIDHEQRGSFFEGPLQDGTAGFYMLQLDHVVFGGGANEFVLKAKESDGSERLMAEGERMGDWAGVSGDNGGLLAAVRDAALQHPKEFQVAADRLNILLFSPRAGHELDFRPEALVESWHLPETYRIRRSDEVITREDMVQFTSNAIGWSKTHDLRLAVLPAAVDAEQVASAALTRSDPVFALVDPTWIYESGALGPLHPVDRDGYAEEEEKVDALVEIYNTFRTAGTGFFGFKNFEAGPVFSGRAERGNLIGERRFRASYGLRNDFWNVFARSGDRDARALAAGSVRRFLDNMIAHHDGPGKEKGLFTEGLRTSYPWIAAGDMPVYWDGRTEIHILGGSDLSNATTDYYLTGYRRAGDIMDNMVVALEKGWTPDAVLQYKRITQSLQNLTEAYAYSGNKELRAMAEATGSYVYDPEADLGLFWGVTDKPWTDTTNLYAVWDILGTPAYYDMAMRLSLWEFERRIAGRLPGGPANPYPKILSFLARETDDPRVGVAARLWLRQYPNVEPSGNTIYAAPFSHGLNVTQDALRHVSEAAEEAVSWVAWNDSGDAPAPRVVYEKDPYSQSLHLSRTQLNRNDAPTELEFPRWVEALDPPGAWRFVGDRTFIRMDTNSVLVPAISGAALSSVTRIHFAKEAPAESYSLRPPYRGPQFYIARAQPRTVTGETTVDGGGRYSYREVPEPEVSRPRLMLHAPEGWNTRADVYGKVYFEVPEQSAAPGFYFTGETFLHTPDGEPFNDGDPVSGWVDLPAGQAGFWSFDQTGSVERVEVRNVPPYFMFDTPENHFIPGGKVRDFSGGEGAEENE